MLDGLKRWFSSNAAAPARGWDALEPWAAAKQYTFRGVPDEGFVLDGRLGATPWRLEWGPSQRPYVQGQELRIRSELGLSADLQLVLMNRQLQVAMEKAVFDQYVEGVQTRIDNQTPPEMRWLVMFPKLGQADMGVLAERFVALSSLKTWLLHWLQGALTETLAAQPLAAETPLVLMIGRGRLMLRTALAEADVPVLERWLAFFETAMREARRVANESQESSSPSTQPSMWATSALPGDERKA
jgi:hypothetical protein